MEAIILAAGRSSRFWPVNNKHKSLIKIMGRPLIFYTLENLKKAGINKIIIVQGPKKDIESNLENYKLKNLEVKYVVQKEPLGTGDALKQVKNLVNNSFLVLNGDDHYSLRDIKKCLSKKNCILLKEVENPQNFGQVLIEKNKVKSLVEKPEKIVSKLVNTGFYLLNKSVFSCEIKKSKRGEYELIDLLKKLIDQESLEFEIAKDWVPVSYPWDLFNVNEFLLTKADSEIKGKVGKKAILKGKIIVEKGAIIENGAYLEGPIYVGKNSQIRPNSFIRKFTCIGDNCYIGHSVEIKNSIIGDNSKIPHLSYLGDSIVGKNCNLGAGTVSANFRFDEKTIKVDFQGKIVDSNRQKLGVVLGNGVKTGINVSFMPGKLIGANSLIGPHSIVFENIEDNNIFYSKFETTKRLIK